MSVKSFCTKLCQDKAVKPRFATQFNTWGAEKMNCTCIACTLKS